MVVYTRLYYNINLIRRGIIKCSIKGRLVREMCWLALLVLFLVVTQSSSLRISRVARVPVMLRAVQLKEPPSPQVDAPPQISKSMQATNKKLVDFAKEVLSLAFEGRPFAYFYALETIARVPYFAYVSVLHLYETLGLFRRKEFVLLHFSESWNELHHLLIMESLGGNGRFADRFISQHMAFFYYWIVVVLYVSAPAVAYDFNKHIENHAFDTYSKYLSEKKDELQALPAPQIAEDYYMKGGDPFMHVSLHTSSIDALKRGSAERIARGPAVIRNLYDVFCEIAKDEKEHALTMESLSDAISLKCWLKNECDV